MAQSAVHSNSRRSGKPDHSHHADARRVKLLLALVAAGAIIGALIAPDPDAIDDAPAAASTAIDLMNPLHALDGP